MLMHSLQSPCSPSDLQSDGSRLSQNDFNCSRVAQHALVLGPGQSIGSDSLQASTAGESGDTALQRAPSQNLSNLNLRAWLLEPLSFRNKGSLTKWQQELRLLRDSQPEPFISQSGTFLSNGVIQTGWTSGRPLLTILQIFFYIFSKREICNPPPLKVMGWSLQTWWAMIG